MFLRQPTQRVFEREYGRGGAWHPTSEMQDEQVMVARRRAERKRPTGSTGSNIAPQLNRQIRSPAALRIAGLLYPQPLTNRSPRNLIEIVGLL
jgi:hypothetical protein